MADTAAMEEVDLNNCSAEELIFRIQLANAEREQAEIVAIAEADNFAAKQQALECELRDTTGMEAPDFEEFLSHLPAQVCMPDAILPLKGTVGQRPVYEGCAPEPEPIEYLDAISTEVKAAAVALREAKLKEEMLVEEVVELKKVRNRLFGDNEGTVSGTLHPVPGMLSDPVSELSIEEVLLLNGSRMHGVENLLTLQPLCEATAAESLQARFANQQIYSCIDAESLVLTNPHAWLPCSSRAMAAFYEGKPFLAPHVNAQAQALLQGIATDGRNRSLFLKGESGSGKSTALTHMLEFCEVRMGGSPVVSKVKHAHAVLSAFTNCLSQHTDNSSRASTCIELQLDHNQELLGCTFALAGLELSRVSECYHGERSFHVLYYVANGTSPPEQEALHFQAEEEFVWLSQNGVSRIPGVDDEAAYHSMKQSLLALEFTAKERAYLLRMISLVLNLGNLQFSRNQTTKTVSVGPSHTMEACATMLRCDVPALAEALSGGFSDTLAAGRARDSFGRLLYSRVVQWVVRRLNAALRCDSGVVNVLMVMDAAGFENNTEAGGNGLDQLLRNYCQEKLGLLGEQLVYSRTEADFAREGIEQPVHSSAAKGVCELFEGDGGLLQLLQNTELAPIELVAAAGTLDRRHIYVHKNKPNCFTVRHTCGDVLYDSTAFRRLSSTCTAPALVLMLRRSLCSFVKAELFSAECPAYEEGTALPPFAQWHAPVSVLAGAKFQLDAIARAVQPSEARFCFCIRPNQSAHPMELDLMVLVREMRSCGLVAYLDFMCNALVWRIPFEEFAAQFHCLYPDGYQSGEGDVRADCDVLLNTHLHSLANVQFGKSRVYLARQQYQQMCTARYQLQAAQAAGVQAVLRAALARGEPSQPSLPVYNSRSRAWEQEPGAYSCEFDKIKATALALVPVMKGWYARSIDRGRAEAEAELARHSSTQPEEAALELEAAAAEEWVPSEMQQQMMLAQTAVEQAKSVLEKFDVPDKEGPLIMGTAFSDLADPDTNLVTRERWNSHFGKDNVDMYLSLIHI
eukprot:TRINITY_DN19417_c0_g1_i2.p1 TRINITY_DN19417_c0_g1~~TRINITY_DN19417_c0_g1_i2.p1  ORF type:complete len:1027 (-),score=370.72 TRINITY_DN19417_c0_g1_i2:124-3204(-)